MLSLTLSFSLVFSLEVLLLPPLSITLSSIKASSLLDASSVIEKLISWLIVSILTKVPSIGFLLLLTYKRIIIRYILIGSILFIIFLLRKKILKYLKLIQIKGK